MLLHIQRFIFFYPVCNCKSLSLVFCLKNCIQSNIQRQFLSGNQCACHVFFEYFGRSVSECDDNFNQRVGGGRKQHDRRHAHLGTVGIECQGKTDGGTHILRYGRKEIKFMGNAAYLHAYAVDAPVELASVFVFEDNDEPRRGPFQGCFQFILSYVDRSNGICINVDGNLGRIC